MKNWHLLVRIIGVSLLITIAGLWAIWYWQMPLKQKIKSSVTEQVVRYEEELNQCVQEYETGEIPNLLLDSSPQKEGSYKKLDNAVVSTVFEHMNVLYISYLSGDEGIKELVFHMTSPLSYTLWEGYEYGFYFSKQDRALNIIEGKECESSTDIYEYSPIWKHYWYRTEKITDDWYFFECTRQSASDGRGR